MTGTDLAGRRKVLELRIETPFAPVGTSLHPYNGPDAGTVCFGSREKTPEVKHAPESASGVVVFVHHYFSAI
jgi:hypothetical protein